MKWLKLTTLTKGFTFVRFSSLALPMARTTLRGYRSIPATAVVLVKNRLGKYCFYILK